MPSILDYQNEDSTSGDIEDLKRSRKAALAKKIRFLEDRILKDINSLEESQSQLKEDLAETLELIKDTNVENKAPELKLSQLKHSTWMAELTERHQANKAKQEAIKAKVDTLEVVIRSSNI